MIKMTPLGVTNGLTNLNEVNGVAVRNQFLPAICIQPVVRPINPVFVVSRRAVMLHIKV